MSGLRWNFKNRLDKVNCIELSYKPRPWVTLNSKLYELKRGAPAFLLPQHVVLRRGLYIIGKYAITAQWFKTTWNWDVCNGPLAHPLARLLALLTHSIHVRATLRSLVWSRAHSLAPEPIGRWYIYILVKQSGILLSTKGKGWSKKVSVFIVFRRLLCLQLHPSSSSSFFAFFLFFVFFSFVFFSFISFFIFLRMVDHRALEVLILPKEKVKWWSLIDHCSLTSLLLS